jgi:hypothetical protein
LSGLKVPRKRLKTLIRKKYVIGNQKSVSLPERWVRDFKLLSFRDIRTGLITLTDQSLFWACGSLVDDSADLRSLMKNDRFLAGKIETIWTIN